MPAYPTDENLDVVALRPAAFINKNSGERSAASFVKEQLEANLGAENVFDLFPTAGQPPAIDEANQFLIDRRPDLVIVAGGDGTVSLAMDITDGLRKAGSIGAHECPVAVLPMGTGNDLSRSLGFGGGYAKPLAKPEEKFKKLIQRTKCAEPRNVDRFLVDIYLVPASTKDEDGGDSGNDNVNSLPSTSSLRAAGAHATTDSNDHSRTYSDDDHREAAKGTPGAGGEDHMPVASSNTYAREAQRSSVPPELLPYRPPRGAKRVMTKTLMNYFSVGFDADIAANFGKFRDENPKACTSRTTNKLWYGCFGCQALCSSDTLPKPRVSLEIGGKTVKIPSKAQAIVVCNMLTYASGTTLWSDSKKRFAPPAVDDKMVEVCLLENVMHMVGVGVHTRFGTKLGQAGSVRLRVPANFTMQYDGEPIEALGDKSEDCIVYLTYHGQSLGTELPKRKQSVAKADGADSPNKPLSAEEHQDPI